MATLEDKFLRVPFTSHTLDIYQVRTSILHALRSNLPLLSGTLLDVGCGRMPYRSMILSHGKVNRYIGMDLEASSLDYTAVPDLLWDGIKIPLPDASIDSAMATEVFEHCPDLTILLKEIYRVLKPGGVVFFTVPFLWPLHDVPYDEYRYTPFALNRYLQNSGFSQIQLKALGGWDASLAQMLGLWVRRRKMPRFKQKLITLIAKPLIHYLISKDTKPVNFTEGTMITGLQGVAIK